MLSVLLTILKIIGILILVVLGLLIAILLIVLLVPVRYSAKGSYYEQLKGTAKVTWLLHILSFKLSYDGELSMTVRIFGVPLKKRHTRETEEEDGEDGVETELYPEDRMVTAQEIKSEDTKPKSKPPVREISKPEAEQPQSAGEKKKDSWFTRVLKKIKDFFKKLKFSFQRMCAKLKDIKNSAKQLNIWFQDVENKALLKLLKRQVFKLIKHVLPRKAKGHLKFGFDDPYTTGQVLSYLSLVYPLYHKQLKLCPVFDGAVLEGEGYIKGRIRLGTVLVLGARLLLNKRFRVLLKKFLG